MYAFRLATGANSFPLIPPVVNFFEITGEKNPAVSKTRHTDRHERPEKISECAAEKRLPERIGSATGIFLRPLDFSQRYCKI